MLRTVLLAALATVFIAPLAAQGETAGDRLIRQEIGSYCEKNAPSETNFQCQIVAMTSDHGPDVPYLQIRWIKPRSQFSEAKQKELAAEVDRLLLHYMRLSGGRCATIYKKYNPEGTVNCCPKKGPQPDYSCHARN